MAVQEFVALPARQNCQCQAHRQRFAEYVVLHATQGRLLAVDEELSVLRIGVTEFGLGLDDARGAMYGAAVNRGIAVESQAQAQMRTYLLQMGKSGRLSPRQFQDAVGIYQALTNHVLAEAEVRRRVKALAEEQRLGPARNWARLGSRRWYNRI